MFGMFRQLLNLLYKRRCYICKSTRDNAILCNDCLKKIRFLPTKPVKIINNADVYSMTIYTGIIMKMIRGLKYHRKKDLAYYHAKLMYDYWKELHEDEEEYIIVPVPMHKTREKQRGYNHMNLIAQEFAKLSGYEINTNLIYRTKNTTPQYALSKEERESNLKNAFGINTKNIKLLRGKKILILDDIITTGTTISEMVSTLRSTDYHVVKAFTASCSEFNIN